MLQTKLILTNLMSSNRTFMELKWRNNISINENCLVLIVPLWNWNLPKAAIAVPSRCSNRTFMELKYLAYANKDGVLIVLIVPLWNWNASSWANTKNKCCGSNRTFMELKSEFQKVCQYGFIGSNRTFMELK